MTFTVIPMKNEADEETSKANRLSLEEKLISLLSYINMSDSSESNWKPSENWLGNFSSEEKIRKSGMWLKDGLYPSILDMKEIEEIKGLGSKIERIC